MNPAISDIGNDIIKSRKRGRPASGRVMDGALFRRVPKERVVELSQLVDRALAGYAGKMVDEPAVGIEVRAGPDGSTTYASTGPTVWVEDPKKGKDWPIVFHGPATGPSQKEFDDLTKWKDQLLLEVAEKDKKLAEFEVRREKWLRASPHEQVLHWISKYDTLVNSIKKNDYDQT